MSYYQQGSIRLERAKSGKHRPLFWLGIWRENIVQPDGRVKRIQRSRKLADYSDRYRSESDVRPLLDGILHRINDTETKLSKRAATDMPLGDFVEQVYLPFVEHERRASTAKSCKNIWKRYLKPYVATMYLRDFRTTNGRRLLETIAHKFDLSKRTLQHTKAMLSGIFSHAKNEGLLDGVNPMQSVELPKARAERDTYAYSLSEVMSIVTVLPEPLRAVCSIAAFTGLREGELIGLNVEDYDADNAVLNVNRTVWRGIEYPPKGKSAGLVPVIPPLADVLDAHIKKMGRVVGPMFRGVTTNRFNLDYQVRTVLKPTLKTHKLDWHGFHAFRRGLATNLHDLGVPDLTIQLILRHSNVSVTQQSYIKRLPHQATEAMARFSDMVEQARKKPVAPISSDCEVVVKLAN